MARLIAICTGLAALTLLFPSSPTYDPWAWIVWGREVLQLDVSTVEGPSWKPLPVLFTAPFSLLGEDVAPQLWLVVARAGALMAVVTAFLVARRLGGTAAAGAAAAGALLLAPWMLRHTGLGNSEGILAALVLAGVLRLLDERPREAFALFALGALLRPEVWPFVALYGLWLMWRDRRAVLLVAGSGVAVTALWFLPEYWGSGNLLRAAERAQEPLKGSPAFSEDPVGQVVRDGLALLTWPVWIGLAVGVAAAVWRLRDGTLERRRVLWTGGLLLTAAAWLGVVALMTGDGFSGTQRYLMMPAILATVAAAGALGWAVRALGDRWQWPAAALLAFLFALPALPRLDDMVAYLRYQGELPGQLDDLIERAGGRERVVSCGEPSTGPFLVPAVAWRLRVHTSEVGVEPKRVPAVVFRTSTNEGSPVVPTLRGLAGSELREAARTRDWRLLAACGPGDGLPSAGTR